MTQPSLIERIVRELRWWVPKRCDGMGRTMLENWEKANDLFAEYEASQKAGGWMPIESAPKNRKARILVVSKTPHITIEYAGFMHDMAAAAVLDNEGCFYTHWQPLPAAPASIGDDTDHKEPT